MEGGTTLWLLWGGALSVRGRNINVNPWLLKSLWVWRECSKEVSGITLYSRKNSTEVYKMNWILHVWWEWEIGGPHMWKHYLRGHWSTARQANAGMGGAAARNRKDHILKLQRRVNTAQLISKWKCGRRAEGMTVNAKSESGGLGRTQRRQDAWRMRAGKNRWYIQIAEWCVALHFWSELKNKKRCRLFEYHRN